MESLNQSKEKYGTMSEPLPAETESYAKAPCVTESVYAETGPLLITSDFAYVFTEVIDKLQNKKLVLDIPDELKDKELSRFLTESADLTEFNDGDGLCFIDMNTIVQHNKEAIIDAIKGYDLAPDFFRMFQECLDTNGNDNDKSMFLTHHRCIQRSVSCVYNVIKDKNLKRIYVSFRGSMTPFTNRDWRTNFNAFAVRMRTPEMIKHKMEGRLKQGVLVHLGFYKYLFDNKKKDGDQRYDNIIKDVEKAIGGEEGYNVYVTGHSLGGALATMLSFKLAGSKKSCHNIPRPITCITFAAPFSGTDGYRIAFEQLEQEGLLRSLRLNNGEDIVPAIPPFSFFPFRLMKHVGINLRLPKSGYRLEHSSKANIWTAFRNSMFKPIWRLMHWHSLIVTKRRFDNNKEALEAVTLDQLYKNDAIVSKGFIDG